MVSAGSQRKSAIPTSQSVDLLPKRVFVFPFKNRHDGAKDLFLRQPHIRLHVCKHGRFVKKPVFEYRVIWLPATANQPATVCQPHSNVVFNLVKLRLADQ